ncbi:MAG: hypothetical protein J7577_11740 [Sphingobacteriaceae bacterium]|nr:hypothetical protein [Sphingobacteriaceae bacterium]
MNFLFFLGKAGSVAFRVMQSRCTLYFVSLPSGLGGPASNNIEGLQGAENEKINL